MISDNIVEILKTGENSRIEFKSEAVPNKELVIVMVSFLNTQGGTIILGVEDDGTISGISLTIDEKMNAIYQICQNQVRPPVIPEINVIKIQNKNIFTITLEKGNQKPYYILKNEKTLFYIRSGTTCRLATPEQIAILYANHPAVHYDVSPVPEMRLEYLDQRRIQQYFTKIKALPEKQYTDRREHLCVASRIAAKMDDSMVATLAGVLLFAQEPSGFVASAGIRCAVFDSKHKDYKMQDHKFLDAPLIPYSSGSIMVEYGLIEQAVRFVETNTRTATYMQGIRRIEEPEYPLETIREVITNALIHRDYALTGGQIQVMIYTDRIEVRSPGSLPNTLTMDMIKIGASYSRNPVLMKFVENYGYVEHLGLGIPEKIVKPMLERGYSHPEFIDNGYEFMVILKRF